MASTVRSFDRWSRAVFAVLENAEHGATLLVEFLLDGSEEKSCSLSLHGRRRQRTKHEKSRNTCKRSAETLRQKTRPKVDKS